MGSLQVHDENLAKVSSRVRHFYQRKQPFRIYHGSTNSTRESQRRRDNTVDTSALNRVLYIDVERKTALVEPNVPMDALVTETVKLRLVPLVVMEFPGITVGGGFSGTSGESSSFRYGTFDATINWVEIVLANGDVTKAYRTKEESTDLFWGAASAFGTLGVVTLLEVQLKDAQPFVQLTYTLCDIATANSMMQQEGEAQAAVDYLDAIVFSRSSTLVCSGRLTSEPPPGSHVQRFLRSFDPWFYIHARRLQKRLSKNTSGSITEYVPLIDYLFRYDRGGFWAAKYSYQYFLVPFNRITRFLLDPLMHTRVMYRALHHSGLSNSYIVQDVGVPYDKVEEFTVWLETTFHIYPLWLCPLRLVRDTPDAGHGLHSQFASLPPGKAGLMNFGVWGPGSTDRREFIRRNQLLEHKVADLGGKKWLYAHAYYTEEDFWAHYDRRSYDAVREKYGASWLPTVYDKVKVDFEKEELELKHIWPLRGLYGVLRTISGHEYLLRKENRHGSLKVE
ncbi:FAD-binding domain-containing protein [Thozetella sp. PMI_491]|nr:FAD-binding domain-containing protein [Thozetella sp. PMI_491]